MKSSEKLWGTGSPSMRLSTRQEVTKGSSPRVRGSLQNEYRDINDLGSIPCQRSFKIPHLRSSKIPHPWLITTMRRVPVGAVGRPLTGLTTHRPGRRKGASLVPRLARTRPLVMTGNSCASRMTPLESPVPEIGTPDSESGGGRKRTHGNRPAALLRKLPDEPPTPYRLRASTRLYKVPRSRDRHDRSCVLHCRAWRWGQAAVERGKLRCGCPRRICRRARGTRFTSG